MATRGSTGASGRSPPKVVLIETRHVRTDEEHFKSVVQCLTGKGSTLEAVVPEKPAIISYLGGVIGSRCGSIADVRRWPLATKYLPAPLQPPLLPPLPSALALKEYESLNLSDDCSYMLHQNYWEAARSVCVCMSSEIHQLCLCISMNCNSIA